MNQYGTFTLTETSPTQSFNEPLSVADMRAILKLPDTALDNDQTDTYLASLISAARSKAEIAQACDLVVKQWDLVLDYWPPRPLTLGSPLVSVDLVQYRDSNGILTSLVENTDYLVVKSQRPGFIVPPYNKVWPYFSAWPESAILIRFTSGYTPDAAFWRESGAMVLNGMRILVADMFNNRLSVDASKPTQVDWMLAWGARQRAL